MNDRCLAKRETLAFLQKKLLMKTDGKYVLNECPVLRGGVDWEVE